MENIISVRTIKRVSFMLLCSTLTYSILGCNPHLEKQSPRQAVKLATKAIRARDRKLLAKLSYIPEGLNQEQLHETVDSLLDKNEQYRSTGAIFRAIFRIKVGEQRIYDDRGYVYLYAGSIVTRLRPHAVLRLDRQGGIWKIRGERRDCESPAFWRKLLKTHPEDTDVLYYLGLTYTNVERVMVNSTMKWPNGDKVGTTFIIIPHNIIKGAIFFDEYIEKDPKGFWASAIRDSSRAPTRLFAKGLKEAWDAYKENPDDIEVLGTLASSYDNLGLFRKSKLAAERFIELAPDDNIGRRGESLRDMIKEAPYFLAIQKEYFDKHPERLKEVEEELGFKLFEGEVTLP